MITPVAVTMIVLVFFVVFVTMFTILLIVAMLVFILVVLFLIARNVLLVVPTILYKIHPFAASVVFTAPLNNSWVILTPK